MTQVAQVLNRAADLIEENGWFQKDSFGRCLCAAYAINQARREGPYPVSQEREALTTLLAHLGIVEQFKPILRVVTWNDAPGRTQQEVVDALRGAALGRIPG
jgi:hypothetical protein